MKSSRSMQIQWGSLLVDSATGSLSVVVIMLVFHNDMSFINIHITVFSLPVIEVLNADFVSGKYFFNRHFCAKFIQRFR